MHLGIIEDLLIYYNRQKYLQPIFSCASGCGGGRWRGVLLSCILWFFYANLGSTNLLVFNNE
jgi:hypothetical protein